MKMVINTHVCEAEKLRLVGPRKPITLPKFSLSFDEPSGFTLVLIPTLIAQVYLQGSDYLERGPFPTHLGYTSWALSMAQFDFSLWAHVGMLALFCLGLAAGVGLLYGVRQIEDL